MQDLSRYVAIAEEFPNTAPDRVKSGGLMHDRRVARIITPGTLIDENFMDPYANNYVMAIHVDDSGQQRELGEELDQGQPRDPTLPGYSASAPPSNGPFLGLAWLDLSTGHFFTQLTDIPSLSSIL